MANEITADLRMFYGFHNERNYFSFITYFNDCFGFGVNIVSILVVMITAMMWKLSLIFLYIRISIARIT